MATGIPLINPPRFTPRRDRRVDVRSVACPSCKAGVRQPCQKVDGTPGSPALKHESRRRMAIRATQEAS